MLLDHCDLMSLRLAGIYRWLPFDSLSVFGFDCCKTEIKRLASLDMVKIARSGSYLRLAEKGTAALEESGYPADKEGWRAYGNSPALRRRLEVVSVMLTALRAGIDPLQKQVDALRNQPVFFPAFALRVGAGNLMNAASCVGFGHWGEKAYMLQYTGPENRGMCLTNELTHFHNLSSVLDPNAQTPMAMIFAGPSYRQVYDRLQKPLPNTHNGKGFVDYAAVYGRSDMPIHLLSCDETGARQLAVMCEPDCNAKLARASFGEGWTPRDADIQEADGHVEGSPLVIAVDMDVRRVERVIAAARRQGRREVLVAALKVQMRGLYLDILPKDGLVTPLSIGPEVLKNAFGKPLALYQMERKLTSGEGDHAKTV